MNSCRVSQNKNSKEKKEKKNALDFKPVRYSYSLKSKFSPFSLIF